MRTIKLSMTLPLALLLMACGSSTQEKEVIPGRFAAKILADGTKLFTYTLGDKEPDADARRAALRRRASAEQAGRREQRAPDPHKPLQLLLQQNRYCRDGYVTLDQSRIGGQQVVRGECRDGATPADRERFGPRG